MDQQQGQQGPMGPAGRRLHIAHRRSPSELTPLMMEQLAIAQQIEVLQQQQQQIAATHQQYVNMGMIQPQQQLGNFQMQGQMPNVSPQVNNYQFAQQMPQQQQHLAVPMNAPAQPSAHRRNQSALPNVGLGPPPAPSSGASGFGDFGAQQGGQGRENVNPRGRGGGGAGGSGHTRRHSLALADAKKAAEQAESKRKTSGFQFPIPGSNEGSSNRDASPGAPGAANDTPSGRGGRGAHGRSQSMAVGRGGGGAGRGGPSFSFPATSENPTNQATQQGEFQRRGSQGHGRSQSRNFEGNWRQPQNNNQQQSTQDNQSQNMGNFNMNQTANAAPFQPGHRSRGSVNQSLGGLGNFQYAGQPQMQMQSPQAQLLLQQQMFGQPLNPMQIAHLQALQAAQMQGGLGGSQHAPQMNMQQQQQQQRKTLFTPYLPQATLPALLGDGQLVAGILRVNKKNRSDAYVTTTDLDADIFICGSKDRNRALEGDLVAVELLDVDEVWGQKREKEEKKKRKDNADPRGASIAVNDATTQPETGSEGGIRRRGSLRQRPTQKKNDDVEVEGQSLLLMEEEEINDELKPLYAGHIVAVIERVAGQMFSGSLGLLRPSSQATKEKQEAERQAREGNTGRTQPERQDKPKIVWFKPTDKRVPLIAIPTEQAPRDFVEKHQEYADRIFVACIKRWPITSLHPFGTLVEQLGVMGDLKVETDALLRDNNFGPDDFSDAVIKNVGFEDWSVVNDGEEALKNRRDFRGEETFTIDPNGSKELDDAIHFKYLDDGRVEIGVHVTDIAHFIKANSLVDREAKKRGTAVYLMNRTVNMLPPKLSNDICCLNPGEERYTVSVVFKADPASGKVFEDETWIGKSVIKSSGKLSYDEVDSVISGNDDSVSVHTSSTTMVFGELSPSPSCAVRKSGQPSAAEIQRRVSTTRTSKRRTSANSENGPQIAPDQSPTRPSRSVNSYQTPSTAALKRPQDALPDVFDATIPQKRTCTSNTKTAHPSGRRADSEEIYSQSKTPETARITHDKLCSRIRTKLSEHDRKKGFIYVFRDENRKEDVWKIGVTERVYNERMEEHINCCKLKPVVAHVSAQVIQNCNLLERLIHRDLCYEVRYRSCPNKTKGHNEWFAVSKDMAVETAKKWERFIHEGKPYDSQGNLNVVWSYVLEQRSPAALDVHNMSHDARHEQWAAILAPPTYSDYFHAYLAYARSELKATYDWVYMFFWQLSTILYSLHTLALCKNRPAFYALVFVLGCAVLPNFRLQSTEKQKVSSPKKKA